IRHGVPTITVRTQLFVCQSCSCLLVTHVHRQLCAPIKHVSRLCRAGVCLEACTLCLNERVLHTCNTAGTSSELKIDLYVCVVWKLQTPEGAQQRWDGDENTRQQPIRPTICIRVSVFVGQG
ncbi:unnamed protein product, partial [Ectocarpus sp. 8 AP-2014]